LISLAHLAEAADLAQLLGSSCWGSLVKKLSTKLLKSGSSLVTNLNLNKSGSACWGRWTGSTSLLVKKLSKLSTKLDKSGSSCWGHSLCKKRHIFFTYFECLHLESLLIEFWKLWKLWFAWELED
jgi:hypothetical protein